MDLTALRKNKHYAEILTRIHEHSPSAIIAGGAVRDLCHGVHVNDIDIYIKHDAILADKTYSAYDEEFWDEIFPMSHRDDYIECMNGDESYEGLNHIDVVWEIQSNDVLYNVILVDTDPKAYVMNYFDIGLCKAYFDGKRFHLSADFITDSKNATLTIVAHRSIKQREFDNMMMYHVAKIQKKYQNHVLIVPKKYEEMYKQFIKNKVI